MTAAGMGPASALGNNRDVTRPGCGTNYVESGGSVASAYALTNKGANNGCSGYMFAGLRNGTTVVWAQHPTGAGISGPATDGRGYHKGCAGCDLTYS